MLLKELEQKLLESAQEAQASGNEAWEVNVRRIHGWLRAVNIETLSLPKGSERYKLTIFPSGKNSVFEFDNNSVVLNGTETDVMRLLTEHPNTILTRKDLKTGTSRLLADRTLQLATHTLRRKIGEDVVVTIKDRGIVFLPNHLETKS